MRSYQVHVHTVDEGTEPRSTAHARATIPLRPDPAVHRFGSHDLTEAVRERRTDNPGSRPRAVELRRRRARWAGWTLGLALAVFLSGPTCPLLAQRGFRATGSGFSRAQSTTNGGSRVSGSSGSWACTGGSGGQSTSGTGGSTTGGSTGSSTTGATSGSTTGTTSGSTDGATTGATTGTPGDTTGSTTGSTTSGDTSSGTTTSGSANLQATGTGSGMSGSGYLATAPQTNAAGQVVAAASISASGASYRLGAFRWASSHTLNYSTGSITGGRFTATASSGSAVYGSYIGAFTSDGSFQLNYTVTGGTGQYAGAQGSGVIRGGDTANGFQALFY